MVDTVITSPKSNAEPLATTVAPDKGSAALQLESIYGLRRSELVSRAIREADEMVGFNIEHLESALLAGLTSGLLKPEAVRGSVVDFGCGRGNSTSLLLGYGSNVTGVELNQNSVNAGRSLPNFPEGKVICTDGIAFLNSLPKGSIDLVTASMLGPDTEGTLSRDFLTACKSALKPRGIILVTTEARTMDTLIQVNPLKNGFQNHGVFIAVRGEDIQTTDLFSDLFSDLLVMPKFSLPKLGEISGRNSDPSEPYLNGEFEGIIRMSRSVKVPFL